MKAPGISSREWPTRTPVTPLVGAPGNRADAVTDAVEAVVVAAGIVALGAPTPASTLSTAPARRSDAGAAGDAAEDLIAARREVPTAAVTVVGVLRAVGLAFCPAEGEIRAPASGVAVRRLAPVDLVADADDVFGGAFA